MPELVTGGRPLGRGVGDAMVVDVELRDLVAAYRRCVASAYRPLRAAELHSLPPGEWLVSTKLDGELWFLVRWACTTLLMNPRGMAITGSFPVLDAATDLPERTVIAGELHASTDGRRARVGDLAAALGGGAQAAVDRVAFAAFDLVLDAGAPVRSAYAERMARLEALLSAGAALTVQPSTPTSSPEDLAARYAAEVESGQAEGLIVRMATGMVYKLKPAIHLDLVVLGFTVSGDDQTRARSLLLGALHPDGRVQLVGSCGNLGDHDARQTLLATLTPLVTSSTVRVASDGGGLYTFVRPTVVAEVRVSDLQGERSEGTTATTRTLQYDETVGWTLRGRAPCPRPLHPVLERLRPDKPVDAIAAGMTQLSPFLPAAAKGEAVGSGGASSVLERKVCTKALKGVTAVRKLVLWKTNKDGDDGTFPAYVVHWTDYSPSRGTPLEREVRLAPDEASARALGDALIAEHIKKGWEAR